MTTQKGFKTDTLFQSVSVAMAVAILCRFVAFGRGVLLTRVFEPAELGTWALVINAVDVLAYFFALGIPNGLTRYCERHRAAGTLIQFFQGVIWRVIGFAVISIGLAILFSDLVGHLLFAEKSSFALVIVTFMSILVTLMLYLGQGVLQGLRLFRINSMFDLSQNLLFLILTITLLFCWQAEAYTVAWANLIATLVIFVVMIYWIQMQLKYEPHQSEIAPNEVLAWKTLFIFSVGAWGAGSCQAIWRVIDRYMMLHLSQLENTTTLDHLGQYFIAAKLGQPIGALALIFSMALLPHAVKMWEDKKTTEVSQFVGLITKIAVFVMVFGGSILILFRESIIQLITGREAALAVTVFVPVLITIILVSLDYILRTYLMCRERTWSISAIWLVALFANGLINMLLIPSYGLQGAAWATMLSALIALALVTLISKQAGMKINPSLLYCLLIPLVLALPAPIMLGTLLLHVLLVQYTEVLFSNDEKKQVNAAISKKLGNISIAGWQPISD